MNDVKLTKNKQMGCLGLKRLIKLRKRVVLLAQVMMFGYVKLA